MGIDYNPQRLEMARQFGACAVDASASDDLVMRAVEFLAAGGGCRNHHGIYRQFRAVSQAAKMCRSAAGLSCGSHRTQTLATGFLRKGNYVPGVLFVWPGRYDASYEQKGQDYPVGFVRWTEQRNFEAVLDMMASNALNVVPLITHRFPIERAEAAYSVLTSGEPSLGIVLEYAEARSNRKRALTQSSLMARGLSV